MTTSKTPAADAVAWHSQIANQFDDAYTRSAAFKERLSLWTSLIDRYVGPETSVLDAGCGPGIIGAAAARRAHRVSGFDASQEMTAIAQARVQREHLTNAHFECGKIGEDRLLQQRPFDVALCSSVLEYLDDYWAAIDWLTSALTPGGMLILSMPNGSSIYRGTERLVFAVTGKPAYLAHVRHMPRIGELERGLAGRQFEILHRQHYGLPGKLPGILRGKTIAPVLAPLTVLVAKRRPAGMKAGVPH